MKMHNRILSAILSFSLVLTLILSVSSPIIASAEGEVVLIESAEDFVNFAKNCSYDLWSNGKTFLLTNDISLEGHDFKSVPVFSGIFDGASHTITGLNLTEAGSPTGLFSILEKDGVIKNLRVVGAVSPEGDAKTIGGIVGENHGRIEGC